jgi:citrate synthase
MKHFFEGYPLTAHPMAILAAMVVSLSSFYPDALDATNIELFDITSTRLLSKVRTIAAFSYKKSIGQPIVYPQNELKYCANLLHMMFATPCEPYFIDPEIVKVVNLLLILHADHEQNCSTNAMRAVGSSEVDPYSALAAAAAAFYGPLHGGANEAVLRMLRSIASPAQIPEFIRQVKTGEAKLMGFGHRVYKNYDPRAKIIKRMADEVFAVTRPSPLLGIARELERIALLDDYFVTRKLYPNVDFYSGLIYEALGFPVEMFPVLFAIPRAAGWLAQWQEMRGDPAQKIARPRQIYTGPDRRDFVPMGKRA